VGPDQPVVVLADVVHAPLVRAITRAAYQAGARRVEVMYEDLFLKQAMVELAPEPTLSYTPPWDLQRFRQLGEAKGALVRIVGEPEPDLLVGQDGRRVGLARPRQLHDLYGRLISQRAINWTLAGDPTEGWARQVFGKPDLERLWATVEKLVRLDEADPAAAWAAHLERLQAIADELNRREFDALRFRGPGTDLEIGLLPSSRWGSARFETAWGRRHVPNLPTEEVFTSPDRRRAEGVVRSTRPLALPGAIVRDLELRFSGGRVVEVKAGSGADIVRTQLEADAGAASLGEVALVDGSSRVGQSGLLFFSTLYDENAACHLAYGHGFAFAVEAAADREAGLNMSAIHTDLMVGGPEVGVYGVEVGGAEVPVMTGNAFRF